MKRKLIKRNKDFMSKLYKTAVYWKKRNTGPNITLSWMTYNCETKYKNIYFKDEDFSHLCVWRMNLMSDWYLTFEDVVI